MHGKQGKRESVTGSERAQHQANIFSRFNSLLAIARSDNNDGCYDIHTNTIQWPSATQPTHARWDPVEATKAGKQNDGQNEQAPKSNEAEDEAVADLTSKFESLDPVYPRNFMIHDVCLQGTPEPVAGPPGIDHNPQRLSNLSADILDELPPECRQALEYSKKNASEWTSRWQTETTDGRRGHFTPTVEWFP